MSRIAYPDDPLMASAWLGLVRYLASEPKAVEAFKEHSGLDLASVLNARGLDKMIDDATGHGQKTMDAFVDWVNEFHWGEDPFVKPEVAA